jgi:hypothetical protein
MAAKKIYTVTQKNVNDVVYHKITIPAGGYIKLEGYDIYRGQKGALAVQLLNSKKKALAGALDSVVGYKSPNYLGVKKGTYYLKVTWAYQYKIKYTFTKFANTKLGTSKAKAVEVKSGQKFQAVFPAGGNGSTAAFYKIKVPYNKQMYINWTAKTNYSAKSPYLEIEFFTSKNKSMGDALPAFTYGPKKTSSYPLPGGTYYVRVKRHNNDKNTSGAFAMKIDVR